MALTMTPEAKVGTLMPTWSLPGADGKTYTSTSTNGKPTVIMFLCNHCPYVKAVEPRILKLAADLGPQGVNFFAVCSNDATEHPEDSFQKIQETWKQKNYSFPYLYDETQGVAKSFGAVCTPDFFLYDANMKLSYRGRLDDSWKNATQVRREDLKTAITDLLNGKTVSIPERPSMGCSIKWKG